MRRRTKALFSGFVAFALVAAVPIAMAIIVGSWEAISGHVLGDRWMTVAAWAILLFGIGVSGMLIFGIAAFASWALDVGGPALQTRRRSAKTTDIAAGVGYAVSARFSAAPAQIRTCFRLCVLCASVSIGALLAYALAYLEYIYTTAGRFEAEGSRCVLAMKIAPPIAALGALGSAIAGILWRVSARRWRQAINAGGAPDAGPTDS